jgi:hypothetical protein
MIAGTKEPSDGGIQASSRTLSKITTDQKQVWPNDTLDTTTHSVKRHGNVKRDSHSEHHLIKAYIASLFFNDLYFVICYARRDWNDQVEVGKKFISWDLHVLQI